MIEVVVKLGHKLILLTLASLIAKADILRLRDGRMFTGNFLGATRTEIWFQRDAPGDFIGTGAYPIEQVESLTFGPAERQSSAKSTAASRSAREEPDRQALGREDSARRSASPAR